MRNGPERESNSSILSEYFNLNTSTCLCAHIYVRTTMPFAAHGGIYSLQMKIAILSVHIVPGCSQTPVPGILLSPTTLSATWPPYHIPNVLCSMLIWDRQGPFSFLFFYLVWFFLIASPFIHSSTHFASEYTFSHVSFGKSCSPFSLMLMLPKSSICYIKLICSCCNFSVQGYSLLY